MSSPSSHPDSRFAHFTERQLELNEVFNAQADLFYSGQYSDLVVRCEDAAFKVHKNILCTRSKFFKACADGGFMEAKSAEIKLEDDDPRAVEEMLFFLYTVEYPGWDVIGDEWDASFRIFETADKYGLSDLKLLAKETISTQIETAFDLDDFPVPVDLVQKIYGLEQEGASVLRELAVKAAAEWSTYGDDRIQELINEIPSFAWDVVHELSMELVASKEAREALQGELDISLKTKRGLRR